MAMMNKAREWVEFGKMWETMVAADFELNLEHIQEHTDEGERAGEMFEVSAIPPDFTKMIRSVEHISGWKTSPYLAMKELYFRLYLKEPDCEDIELDIDDDIYVRFCDAADELGITLDEFFTKALKAKIAQLENEEKKCGVNCNECD
jgi:hypothetical protein